MVKDWSVALRDPGTLSTWRGQRHFLGENGALACFIQHRRCVKTTSVDHSRSSTSRVGKLSATETDHIAAARHAQARYSVERAIGPDFTPNDRGVDLRESKRADYLAKFSLELVDPGTKRGRGKNRTPWQIAVAAAKDNESGATLRGPGFLTPASPSASLERSATSQSQRRRRHRSRHAPPLPVWRKGDLADLGYSPKIRGR
jgi:hypothetical protein